ncbi:MAG: hypothetical protein LLF83_11570 [Methanobacterium sp.]|nr:hypothetical protein [Methanobacterium sp.]
MILYSYIGLVLAIVNICMLLVLLSIYWKNYSKWKSQYTIGLLVFGIFLLLQNILSLYYSAPPPGPTPPTPGPAPGPIESPHYIPLLLINTSQLIALAALLKISWK